MRYSRGGKKGIIFNIQRFSINDGPGIRTVVFLKGCTLSCMWCFNPESQDKNLQIFLNNETCIECNRCFDICPVKAISIDSGERKIDRSKCNKCGKCVEVCNSKALSIVGEEKTADEVIDEIIKDKPFYDKSNGGVTLSGGEALHQPEFSKAILKKCKKNGINTAIETSGYIKQWELFEELLDYTDLVLYDLKQMDNSLHKKFTGVENKIIFDNARKISSKKIPMVIRIPIIPGYSDSRKNITETCLFVKNYLKNVREIDILPFSQIGRKKYSDLGMNYQLSDLESPKKEYIKKLKELIESFGFYVLIGG